MTQKFDFSCTKLSERHIEMLYWVAEGKSNWEISKILETNSMYINNCLRKIYIYLDAVNRAHAVAKAMRIGIIK